MTDIVKVAAAGRERGPEAGLLQLPGEPPQWIWTFTCPSPGCGCRTAVVLATQGGQAELVSAGAVVRQAWMSGKSYAEAAAGLAGVTGFAVDIDTGALLPLLGDEDLDLEASPEIAAVGRRIDGPTLDELEKVWSPGERPARSYRIRKVSSEDRDHRLPAG